MSVLVTLATERIKKLLDLVRVRLFFFNDCFAACHIVKLSVNMFWLTNNQCIIRWLTG